MIMKELGILKQYQMMGRIDGLRKRGLRRVILQTLVEIDL